MLAIPKIPRAVYDALIVAGITPTAEPDDGGPGPVTVAVPSVPKRIRHTKPRKADCDRSHPLPLPKKTQARPRTARGDVQGREAEIAGIDEAVEVALAATAAPPFLTVATGGKPPTAEQDQIVAAAKRLLLAGTALRIIAYAGAGKTSTLKMVAGALGRAGVYVAFNKDIARDAQRSFPDNVACLTMHSLAWRAVGMIQAESAKGLNAHWVRDLLGEGRWMPARDAGVPAHSQRALVARVLRAFCTSAAPQPMPAHVQAVLDAVVYRPPATPPTDRTERRRHEAKMAQRTALTPFLLERARTLWSVLWDTDGFGWRKRGVAIPHDVYLKVFERSPALIRQAFQSFDYVLLDEAQDLNPVMRSIATASEKPLVAVGDSFQQIYSWRGAEDALKLLPGEALYLSASFRFGTEIARFAAEVLATRPGGGLPVPLRGLGPAGAVRPVDDPTTAPVVLCRTNAGCLRVAGKAALAGRPVHVVGGIADLATEMRSAVALFEGRLDSVTTDALKRFESWKQLREEADALQDADLLRLVEIVEDKVIVQTLVALERWHTTEDRAEIVVSTTHKAKGREWPLVALADDFPGPVRALKRYRAAMAADDADRVRAVIEEWHVLYVGATRAKTTLLVARRLHDAIRGHC